MNIISEMVAVRSIEETLRCPRDNGLQIEERNCFSGRYIQWRCLRCGFVENDTARHWRAIAKRHLQVSPAGKGE